MAADDSRGESSAPGTRLIECERRGGTLVLTLAQPETRNCLSEGMIEALQNAIEGASHDASVRATVIAARGSVFCSGHDLKELTSHRSDADGGRAFTRL